jgi:hypothetical protein
MQSLLSDAAAPAFMEKPVGSLPLASPADSADLPKLSSGRMLSVPPESVNLPPARVPDARMHPGRGR